ncbi:MULTISPECIES: DUF86 domain-containing protein [unclassified Cyanobium]|uniref:HepT-like ribonuclease domain-containing protein n=1 Tax=unclassified Cyanobium TaxID=2627006 RepID=UPI0020CDB2AF|nr:MULTISPECIES: HepT-like ribonuclease domain-containing protein [unclassified Cyanobium]MCP9861117.1 DUF86 domain-containing protein [Cyanobium sp. Cruz-8H5]MCP9868363.1 DUF86 domain-containing protein [Cyanobium sp. Cruz-8D1]
MTRRDSSVYLLDILEACLAIEAVLADVSLVDYRSRRSVRSSVEREFILIGEALTRLCKIEASTFDLISNSRLIIDFRNLLAHDYGAIDDDAVYGLAFSDLIVLKAEVTELLDQRGESIHDAAPLA